MDRVVQAIVQGIREGLGEPLIRVPHGVPDGKYLAFLGPENEVLQLWPLDKDGVLRARTPR